MGSEMRSGMMNGKTIYYRGLLKFCNYRCGYCPFSKTPFSEKQIKKDQDALAKFCDGIRDGEDLGIMFLPYGEALIHSYYIQQIGQLSSRDNIRFVACQTNLSFDVDRFVQSVMRLDKIKLWCSFHPSQTTLEQFLGQCQKLLDNQIDFCVGAVGVPEELEAISHLRSKLDPRIYLWINNMDGKKRRYTDAEIAGFSRIDPLFKWELARLKARPNQCRAGMDSVFADGKGDLSACNISRVNIGNLYRGGWPAMAADDGNREQICKARYCDCYLAYSRRTEFMALNLFKDDGVYRIPRPDQELLPKKTPPDSIRAVFFDVDGTLADGNRQILPETKKALGRLAASCKIYLATSLPYRNAYRICKEIWPWLDGGVFAEGSDIRLFSAGYHYVVPIATPFPADFWEHFHGDQRQYRINHVLHKVALRPKKQEKADWNLSGFHVVKAGGWIGITDEKADKLKGVIHLCGQAGYWQDQVAVVGNDQNDLEMLAYFNHSFAVDSSGEIVKQAAKNVCAIEQIDCRIKEASAGD